MWMKSGLCLHVQRHIASTGERQYDRSNDKGLEWVCEKCGKHFVVPMAITRSVAADAAPKPESPEK